MTLVAGQDYPDTYRQFVEMFPDNKACVRYLVQLRWPDGFVCPACKTYSTPWNESRDRIACSVCRHQTSIKVGTIFEKTRTDLITWFEAAWHLTTAKNGMSAKTLERTLGVSYRVAWMMLQRFRVSMVSAERKQLVGRVEVDETLIGGVKQGGKRGRGVSKSVVVIAVEVKKIKGFGRIRMRHVPDASGDSLLPFICDMVNNNSIVLTDGWSGYNGLSKLRCKHEVTILASSGDPAHVSMPGVHRVASLLKRWILGTHQGAVVPAHLQSYLEEFTFRFNRRTSNSRGLVFRRRLEHAVLTKPVIANDVKFGYDWKSCAN